MGHPPKTATPPLSPCSTSAQVDGPPRASPRNARSERIAMWQPHSCRLWHWPLRVVFTVGSVKSAAWLRGRTAHNGSLSSHKTYSGKVGSDILLKKNPKKTPPYFPSRYPSALFCAFLNSTIQAMYHLEWSRTNETLYFYILKDLYFSFKLDVCTNVSLTSTTLIRQQIPVIRFSQYISHVIWNFSAGWLFICNVTFFFFLIIGVATISFIDFN